MSRDLEVLSIECISELSNGELGISYTARPQEKQNSCSTDSVVGTVSKACAKRIVDEGIESTMNLNCSDGSQDGA